MIASAISSFDTSSSFAALTWMSMQYGHPVTCATATAISSFVRLGITPSATAALSNAAKLLNASGASLVNSDNLLMLPFSYKVSCVMLVPPVFLLFSFQNIKTSLKDMISKGMSGHNRKGSEPALFIFDQLFRSLHFLLVEFKLLVDIMRIVHIV